MFPLSLYYNSEFLSKVYSTTLVLGELLKKTLSTIVDGRTSEIHDWNRAIEASTGIVDLPELPLMQIRFPLIADRFRYPVQTPSPAPLPNRPC